MAVRAPGDFPPDESGAPPFQDNVDLPWWQGGGQGFGPGGFQGNPRLTGPASGPAQGLSLSTDTSGVDGGTFNGATWKNPRNWIGPKWGGGPPPTGGGGAPAIQDPPVSRGASGPGFAGWRNPFTSPYVDPTTGKTVLLSDPNLAEKSNIGGFNPGAVFNRARLPLLAGAGVIAATPAETGEFNPPMVAGRPEAPMSGVHGNPAAAAPATYPHMPWPDTGVAPAASPQAPVASPAATRQRPNLGTYGAPPAAVANSPFTTFDRPNMSPQNSAQGRQGAPQMGMLDLSRLFGGGQPAPAAATPIAARPDLAQRVPLAQTPLPVPRPAPAPPRRPKVKVSSTSQGGGFT